MDGVRDGNPPLAKVEAELVYLIPGSEKPRTFCYKLPPGVPHSNYSQEKRRHFIHDARPIIADLDLDVQGIELIDHPTAFTDFHDHDAIRSRYYPEVERILKEATAADRVFAFGHTVRREQADVPNRTENDRMPVQQVHVDRTDTFGADHVRARTPEEADSLLGGRVQVINFWRPIRGPVESMPLAVCDARSVQPDQIVAVEMVMPQQSFYASRLTYDAAHRWLYFPRMRTDEVLIFKCFDTLQDGRARYVPHTAFADPTTPPGAAPRESIEVQTIVLHRA